MADVNSKRSKFPRHRLRKRPQSRFGRCECAKRRAPAQTRAGTCENDRAPATRRQATSRFPPDQKPAESSDPPRLLENSAGMVRKS
jgi:hypothetical protein